MRTLLPANQQVLTSMPGVGFRTAARNLLEVGDATSFATPGHLAANAVWHRSPVALGPRSAVSTRPATAKQLKRAFFLSAFAALHDPASRAHYDRKGAEGERRNAAPIYLARRRVDILSPMLRDGTRPRRLPEPIGTRGCSPRVSRLNVGALGDYPEGSELTAAQALPG